MLLSPSVMPSSRFLNQAKVADMMCPVPAREGLTVPHSFPFGSSGPFGEDTPGEWLPDSTMRRSLDRIGTGWPRVNMMQALMGGSICTRGGRGGWHDLSASDVTRRPDMGCVGLQPSILASLESRGL